MALRFKNYFYNTFWHFRRLLGDFYSTCFGHTGRRCNQNKSKVERECCKLFFYICKVYTKLTERFSANGESNMFVIT